MYIYIYIYVPGVVSGGRKDCSSVYSVSKCPAVVHFPYVVLYKGENTVATECYWFIDRPKEMRTINVTANS